MFELIVLVLLWLGPFILGARTRSWWSVTLPAAVFALAAIGYANSEPTGDEVDVIPGVIAVLTGVGVLLCLAGVVLGRRFLGPRV